MLAWLMLRPKVIAGVGVLAVVASLWVAWKWEVRGLKKAVAKSEQALSVERTRTAGLEASVHERDLAIDVVEADRDARVADIAKMNASIERMATASQAAQASAVAAALRVLRQGDALAEAQRRPETVPPGAANMTAWYERWRAGFVEVAP